MRSSRNPLPPFAPRSPVIDPLRAVPRTKETVDPIESSGAFVTVSAVRRTLAVRFACLLALSATGYAQAPAKRRPLRITGRNHGAGMPPVTDARNLYSETTTAKMNPAVAGDLPRVYVPHIQSNDVYVIDPPLHRRRQVQGRIEPAARRAVVGLRTLWVANNAENTNKGSVIPIDPKTGKFGKPIAGRRSLQHVLLAGRQVGDRVAEAMKRLDFRDPQTMKLSIRSTCRAAPGSTTRTSRSTAASRSSRASSRAPWPRSISSTARCWGTSR
jgi:hypothetical protein